MKKIKVKFVDTDQNLKGLDCFRQKRTNYNPIMQALSKNYIVEESDDPEYVFSYVPVGRCKGYDYGRYKNAILCFIQNENVMPDYNAYDYAIGPCHTFSYEDRYMYFPSMLLCTKMTSDLWESLRTKHRNCSSELSKRKFCSFTVSNYIDASRQREEFFHLLNGYKRVDSGGRFLNNIGGGPIDNKVEFDLEHKFSITFENTWYSYVTEKIGMAFAAKTVPIYWGNPKVGQIYNEKAFVNCHAYQSFEEVVERVKEIDNDEELYLSMLREPALLADKKKEEYFFELEKFLINMIETPKELACRRCGIGWQKKMADMRLDGFKKLYRKRKIKNTFFSLGGKVFKPIKNTKFARSIKRHLYNC